MCLPLAGHRQVGLDFGIEKNAGEGFKKENHLYACVHMHRNMSLHICAHGQKSAPSVPTLLFLKSLASVTFYGTELGEI